MGAISYSILTTLGALEYYQLAIKLALFLLLLLSLFLYRNTKWLFVLLFFIAALFPEGGRNLFPSIFAYFDLILFALAGYTIIQQLKEREYPRTILDGTVLLFFFFGVITLIRGTFLFSAPLKPVFFDFFQRTGHVLTFFVVTIGFKKDWIKPALSALIAGTVIAAIYGILQFIFGFSIIMPISQVLNYFGNQIVERDIILQSIWWGDHNLRKAFALYYGPNSFAGLLAFVLPIVLVFLYLKPPKMKRITLVLSFILIYLALQFTFSRTSLFAIMIVFLFLLGHSLKTSRKKWAILFLILLVLTPLFYFSLLRLETLFDNSLRETSTKALKEKTVSMKIEELSKVPELVDKYSYGLGFGVILKDQHPAFVRHANHISNLYLQILTQMGIFGLATFLFIVIVLAMRITTGLKRIQGEQNALLCAVGMAILSALANGVFDHPFFTTSALSMLFWAFAGMVMVLTKDDRNILRAQKLINQS